MAKVAGVPLDVADRLWRALGFAEVAEDSRSFTDRDALALREAVMLEESGIVDEASLLAMTRAMAQSLSRLAEWQAESVGAFLAAQQGTPTVADALGAAELLLPVLERLSIHVWRRHLVAFAGRVIAVTPEELPARRLGVGFADLVGFTALSRRIGEAQLAAVIDAFEGQAADLVTEQGGRVVKTVGDEVLFATEQVAHLAEIGLQLAERFDGSPADVPPVRVGLAYGTVLNRLGDVYGTPVNLAARLTSLARPGTVLVDREIAALLEGNDAYRLTRLRRVSVRGFEHLEAARLQRA